MLIIKTQTAWCVVDQTKIIFRNIGNIPAIIMVLHDNWGKHKEVQTHNYMEYILNFEIITLVEKKAIFWHK